MNVHLRDFEEDARGLIPKMIKESLNIIKVPDSSPIVVVRATVNGVSTEEYNDRTGEPDVTKFLLKTQMPDGSFEDFYIFSR